MAITLGADPNWYYAQAEQRSRSLGSVLDAMQGYEDRKRVRAGQLLEFMDSMPGSASGDFGNFFLEKYGDDPEMRALYGAIRAKSDVLSSFMSRASTARDAYGDLGDAVRDTSAIEQPLTNMAQYAGVGAGGGFAGIGGLLGTVASSMARPVEERKDELLRDYLSEDPSGLQQAFSRTSPEDHFAVMKSMQGVGIPSSRLMPQEEKDPLMTLIQAGQVDPDVLRMKEEVDAGLRPSPRYLEERAIANQYRDMNREDQQSFLKQMQEDRQAEPPKPTKPPKPFSKTYAQEKKEAATTILSAIPVPEPPKEIAEDKDDLSLWEKQQSRSFSRIKRQVDELAIKVVNTNQNPAEVAKIISDGLASGMTYDQIFERLNRLMSGGAGGSGGPV